jgi:hypothetical protein
MATARSPMGYSIFTASSRKLTGPSVATMGTATIATITVARAAKPQRTAPLYPLLGLIWSERYRRNRPMATAM